MKTGNKESEECIIANDEINLKISDLNHIYFYTM